MHLVAWTLPRDGYHRGRPDNRHLVPKTRRKQIPKYPDPRPPNAEAQHQQSLGIGAEQYTEAKEA
ncbi:hypothetical protein E4U42_003296 [Claviceps africana]|uniref:Uncharacterized protein n=1 Tax=Claviceps africana TaxID=83212 RepID=A0A8K0NLP1_9HYPO|nr:hypothetical protein E4U42_003296 [Claviceps africana]